MMNTLVSQLPKRIITRKYEFDLIIIHKQNKQKDLLGTKIQQNRMHMIFSGCLDIMSN